MTATATVTTSNAVVYDAPNAPAASTAPAAPASDGLTFHELLSDINPLQYVPGVGTIYRAITGDTIPKPLREVGSIVVGGLLGGPIGAATSLATLAFEKITGIDLEDVEQRIIASIIGPSAASPAAAGAPAAAATAAVTPQPVPAVAAPADATATVTTPAGGAWTSAQLAAYGVATLPDGTLRQGDLTGADVLNALQLSRTAVNA